MQPVENGPSRKLRVCFVAPFAFPALSGNESLEIVGGAEIQQLIVARRLVARGYEVTMICLDFGQPPIVEIDGIRVYRAYKQDSGIPVLRFIWPRISSILRCMASADADIYYQRSAGRNTALVAAFCRWRKRRSIFAASGNPDFQRATRRVRARRNRFLYEYGLRRVDRVLAQNPEQIALCRENFGREATLVPNCYEPPGQLKASSGCTILWVGTIRELKRPELFLDVAAQLPMLDFVMVGGSAPGDRGKFRGIKERAESMTNVRFQGFVPHNFINKFFDSAALLVNTSESEGFPNTFLEAWARGIPTVSFVDCGARHDGRVPGCVVASVSKMVAMVSHLMSDDSARLEMGARARIYFEKNHSPESIVDIYERVFRDLTSR